MANQRRRPRHPEYVAFKRRAEKRLARCLLMVALITATLLAFAVVTATKH